MDRELVERGKDADEETNEKIKRIELTKRSKNTIITGTVKMMTKLTGGESRMRKKILCEIQSTSDVKVWSWSIHGVTITCAKVFNPAILLEKNCKIENIKNIQRLEVEDPEEILTAFPKSLVGNLKKLESFSMTWTKIKSLPSNFYHARLKHLWIQRNRVTNLYGISKASGLETINANNNCILALPSELGHLTSLTELHISNNFLKQLPESISTLASLKVLDCSCNKLESLPVDIGNLIKLNTLDVTANQLTNLPFSIGHLPELADLRVASNFLENLPNSFSLLKNLKSLNMRKNRFEHMPRTLDNFNNLLYLNLRDNSIIDFDISLASLKHLNLNGNRLKVIPSKIFECRELELLSLQKNSIEGIPTNIASLKNLKTLLLGNNDISEIPEEIFKLSSLKHMDLRGAKIQRLPLSMRFMVSLTFLELEHCIDLDPLLKAEYNTGGIDGLKNYLGEKAAEEEPLKVEKRKKEIGFRCVKSFFPV